MKSNTVYSTSDCVGGDLPPARPESPERALMNALLSAADALDAAWCFAGSRAAREAVLAYLKAARSE